MYNIDSQDSATILAALRFYQERGMGDPANRSDAINDIATNGGEVISLDAEGIDDLCERLNTAERPMLAIVVEGGIIQSLVSNVPEAYSGHKLLVIDYDDEGTPEEELTDVPQADGSMADAICHMEEVDKAAIDLGAVLRQLEG